MNKDTYLILTEMKWVFLGCTNSLETQQEGQTRKQNFVEEKGSRLLPQNVLSGEKKKSAKFTPLLFQTLIECKTNKHWNEKRGENTYFMWEKKAQYPLQNKNADFLSLSRSASQQQTLLTASFWADWKHSDYFQRSSPSLVVMFGCNWNLLMGRIHLCFRGGAAQHQQQLSQSMGSYWVSGHANTSGSSVLGIGHISAGLSSSASGTGSQSRLHVLQEPPWASFWGELPWVQLCNWSKKKKSYRELWEIYISLHIRMST